MKYRIDKFVLNDRDRTLRKAGQVAHIRPKTQALLIFLAQNQGKILSKQALLDTIWHDVKVDEGVVFQSVREIRQLFDDPHIIQNHPRQGYEFTGTFEPIINRSFWPGYRWLKIALPLLGVFVATILGLQINSRETGQVEFGYKHNILVLPVKNHVHYGQHDWVYLGAMEQMIGKLKGLKSDIYVHDGSYTLRLVNQLGFTRDFTTADIAKHFSAMGNTLIIESEVHGNTSDYKLIYKLHRESGLSQGAILSSDIDDALTSLTELVATEFDSALGQSSYIATEEFNDALFAQAMITYEQDWQTAISFFQSYLALQPDSVIAKIYLSKLYLWQKQTELADFLIKSVPEASLNSKLLAEVTLIKGRIEHQKTNYLEAHHYYDKAEKHIHQSHHWLLKASIANERAQTWLAKHQLEEAQSAWHSALDNFHIIHSPIGIHATNLHLAWVAFKMGDYQKAEKRLNEAKEAINTMELEFLYSMLEDYEQKIVIENKKPQ